MAVAPVRVAMFSALNRSGVKTTTSVQMIVATALPKAAQVTFGEIEPAATSWRAERLNRRDWWARSLRPGPLT